MKTSVATLVRFCDVASVVASLPRAPVHRARVRALASRGRVLARRLREPRCSGLHVRVAVVPVHARTENQTASQQGYWGEGLPAAGRLAADTRRAEQRAGGLGRLADAGRYRSWRVRATGKNPFFVSVRGDSATEINALRGKAVSGRDRRPPAGHPYTACSPIASASPGIDVAAEYKASWTLCVAVLARKNGP
jgi:hypothetical protein